MRKSIVRIATTLIAFGTMLPIAAQGSITVTGIQLLAAPNAMGVRWQAPTGGNIDHYKVYFAKESILENNGRFLGTEETIGNQTNIALLDLANRGFVAGDTMYVTITAVDTTGMEYRAFGEEKSATVIVSEGSSSAIALHNAASFGVMNAIAEGESTIRLIFTAPVAVPEGHPAIHFTITGENGSVVSALSAIANGDALVLRTTPMAVRTRYTITALSTVKGADGTTVDPTKNSATFAARPSGEEEAIPTVPAPVSSSSSVGEVPALPTPQPTTTQPIPLPTPVLAPDTTPPEDAANLTLQRILQPDGNYTVKAEWTGSLNTARDLSSYHLYESPDRGYSFVGPTVLLGTVVSSTIANIPPGTFTLKLTAVDQTGNESNGIMETIILPQTGAATLLLSSAGAALVALRKNRKRARARK